MRVRAALVGAVVPGRLADLLGRIARQVPMVDWRGRDDSDSIVASESTRFFTAVMDDIPSMNPVGNLQDFPLTGHHSAEIPSGCPAVITPRNRFRRASCLVTGNPRQTGSRISRMSLSAGASTTIRILRTNGQDPDKRARVLDGRK